MMSNYSTTGYSESELDESSSTASSPLSISSVDASSPFDSSRLSGADEELNDTSFPSSVGSPSSISDSPSPTKNLLHNNSYQHHTWMHNPYYNGSKSVRWFRDDRGLWSERSSSSVNCRRKCNPYRRNVPLTSVKCDSEKVSLNASNTTQNKEISEVLIEAVRREDQALLRHLLAKSAAHVNILGHEGDSPLHRSCRQGNLDTVKLLVRHGADPELANREGWSPLHLAVHSGYHDVVVYLLSLTRR